MVRVIKHWPDPRYDGKVLIEQSDDIGTGVATAGRVSSGGASTVGHMDPPKHEALRGTSTWRSGDASVWRLDPTPPTRQKRKKKVSAGFRAK